MVIGIICYIITSISLMLYFCFRPRVQELPNLKLNKYGLTFYSTATHKIFVGKVKLIDLTSCAYLKQNNKMVKIQNVKNVKLRGQYLYFTALGRVKIIFNCTSFYKYFNIIISSPKYNFASLKQAALIELANNLFNINNCQTLKYYISLLHNQLNITISASTIKIAQNPTHFPFTVTYLVNNKIKKLQINQ